MRNGKKPHSLGSINSTQHSSKKGRGGNEKKQRRGRIFWKRERAVLKDTGGEIFLKLIEEEVCNKESYGERLRREETKQQRTTRHQR